MAAYWEDDEDPGPLTLRQLWAMVRYMLRSLLGLER